MQNGSSCSDDDSACIIVINVSPRVKIVCHEKGTVKDEHTQERRRKSGKTSVNDGITQPSVSNL